MFGKLCVRVCVHVCEGRKCMCGPFGLSLSFLHVSLCTLHPFFILAQISFEFSMFNDLPDEIPAVLVVGTPVTG